MNQFIQLASKDDVFGSSTLCRSWDVLRSAHSHQKPNRVIHREHALFVNCWTLPWQVKICLAVANMHRLSYQTAFYLSLSFGLCGLQLNYSARAPRILPRRHLQLRQFNLTKGMILFIQASFNTCEKFIKPEGTTDNLTPYGYNSVKLFLIEFCSALNVHYSHINNAS